MTKEEKFRHNMQFIEFLKRHFDSSIGIKYIDEIRDLEQIVRRDYYENKR